MYGAVKPPSLVTTIRSPGLKVTSIPSVRRNRTKPEHSGSRLSCSTMVSEPNSNKYVIGGSGALDVHDSLSPKNK